MPEILKVAALDKALPLVKEFEGCRLSAYQCPAGVWTIGYGQTKGIKAGMKWTQQQAEDDLRVSLMQYLEEVADSCPQLLDEPDYRLAACTSLNYNIGIKQFASSSVARYIREGNWIRAEDAFHLWNKVKGKVNNGLVRRRKAEAELFSGGRA